MQMPSTDTFALLDAIVQDDHLTVQQPLFLDRMESLEAVLGAPPTSVFGQRENKCHTPLSTCEGSGDEAADDLASFMYCITDDAPPAPTKPTSCDSPTHITDMLLTPLSKRKRPTPLRADFAAQPPAVVVEDSAAASHSEWAEWAAAAADVIRTVDNESDSASSVSSPALRPTTFESEEDKRAERMRRNRASAAESRKRKRQHVEELEELVAQLKNKVHTLREENATLQHKCELARSAAACDA